MQIKLLEHVNLRTTDLKRLEKWYESILGLNAGYRPPFGNEGRWMYAGDIPIVHLLEVKEAGINYNPTNEHFAMRAEGLKSLLTRLDAKKIPYWSFKVPELGILQINISDPDGNNMHIDFSPEEAEEAGF